MERVTNMDPTTGWAALGGLISLGVSLAGWLRYKRGKREKLGQAETDELKRAMDAATTGNEPPLKLRVDDKDAGA